METKDIDLPEEEKNSSQIRKDIDKLRLRKNFYDKLRSSVPPIG